MDIRCHSKMFMNIIFTVVQLLCNLLGTSAEEISPPTGLSSLNSEIKITL